ncbi:hypothetical protein CSC70_11825 [Pseudoxanthomonas kalamensis DSM 18571]|nr:hypothetical protein CSC70_11825 [Pseudoxanthomonas kalamensis DSM 18571]
MLLPGMALLALLWTMLALQLQRQCGWMAVVGAVDAVLLLRLSGMAPGMARTLLAVLATAATIALTNWGIAAMQIGAPMGLGPLDALLKMGPALAWQLAQLANGVPERLWSLAALAVAALLGAGLSGRRRAPSAR